jgi:hypothetical protein
VFAYSKVEVKFNLVRTNMNRVRLDFHEEEVRLPTVSSSNKNKNKRKRQWVLLFYCYRKRQMWSKAHEGLRSIAYFSKWLINVQFVVTIFVLGTKKKVIRKNWLLLHVLSLWRYNFSFFNNGKHFFLSIIVYSKTSFDVF